MIIVFIDNCFNNLSIRIEYCQIQVDTDNFTYRNGVIDIQGIVDKIIRKLSAVMLDNAFKENILA
jgi:hypothetical protein